MIIERLNQADRDTAEELWSLQHAAYRMEAALVGAAELPPLRETVAELMGCRETFWGCRSSDGELVGAISADFGAVDGIDTAVVCRLMVHPGWFRQGIGRCLLERAFAEFPENRRWEVTAEVRNLPALSLYEKCGFRQVESFSPLEGIVMARLRREAPALPD